MMICVYGAASNNIRPSYISAVEELGRKMSARGHGLVYGAGANGLMGAVARGVYENRGEIIGVAPSFFNVDGILFEHATKLISTETMRERKQIMEDYAEAFIMVPGGMGTFDEFFEILTLKQLARHNKPLVIFNLEHYYDPLLSMMEHAAKEGFVAEKNLGLYKVLDDIDEILEYIETYIPEEIEVEKLRQITK